MAEEENEKNQLLTTIEENQSIQLAIELKKAISLLELCYNGIAGNIFHKALEKLFPLPERTKVGEELITDYAGELIMTFVENWEEINELKKVEE